MRKVIIAALLVLVLGPVISGCSEQIPSDVGSEIGDRALDFDLMDSQGKPVSLSDFRGTPVVMNFWAFSCGPCIEEIPLIQALYEKWPAEELMVLTINLDRDQAQIAQSMELFGISFPVLLGAADISELYGIRGIPTTFFMDKDGIIQRKVIGAFQDLADIESQLDKIVPQP